MNGKNLLRAETGTRSARSPAILSGVIGALIGLVCLLANLRDMASVGQGMAKMLLASLYAATLYLTIILPCLIVVRKKQALKEGR